MTTGLIDVGNEYERVVDVDSQSLIKIVKFLKRGKDTIHNEVLKLGTTTSLFHHLAKLFTSNIQLGARSELFFLGGGWQAVSLGGGVTVLEKREIWQGG